jgi:type II secretory pathway pseudopilin PulG
MDKTHPKTRIHAFTLTEIMIVTTILGFVSVGLVQLLLGTQRGMFWATNKSMVTKDVRLFTMRISDQALDARTGYVYESFAKAKRDSAGDRRRSAETGDCLVLVSYDPYPNLDDPPHYTKLVVFFRRPDSDGIGPVYMAEKEFSTPVPALGTNDTFEEVLAKHFPNDSGDWPIVLELSRGLADGRLFRVFGDNTFVINGEIIHGNKIKEVTNTYNLTISPRG